MTKLTDSYQTYRDQFIMYINAKSLCCTPEINIILYVNYTSIKKKKERKASMLCPTTGECTFFSTTHGTFTKINNALVHEASLN